MATDANIHSDHQRDPEPLEPTVFEHQPGGAPQGGRPAERTELIADQDQGAGQPMAWVIITSQGARQGDLVRITGSSFLIGRASDCDLILDDTSTSRQHARIRVERSNQGARFVVHDLATDNGTLVNGERKVSAELQTGDVIRIGRTELTFKQLA